MSSQKGERRQMTKTSSQPTTQRANTKYFNSLAHIAPDNGHALRLECIFIRNKPQTRRWSDGGTASSSCLHYIMYNFVIITKCHLSKVQLVLSLGPAVPVCVLLAQNIRGSLVCESGEWVGSSPFSACLAHALRVIKGLRRELSGDFPLSPRKWRNPEAQICFLKYLYEQIEQELCSISKVCYCKESLANGC